MKLVSRVSDTENTKDKIVMKTIKREIGNRKFKSTELDKHFDHTSRTTYNRLVRLEKRGFVSRSGSGKGTYWWLNTND